jgi:hypothetical protein
MRPKHFEVCNVRFTPVPALVWSLVSGRVDEPIVKIHRVQKGSRPELGREAGAIEKCPNFDRQRVIIYLGATVLQRAVGTGRFDDVPKLTEHHVAEGRATSQFSTLISPYDAIADTKFFHERSEDIQWWFFGLGEECPHPS